MADGDTANSREQEGTMLNDIGRVCVKIAGRDAGKKCAIIDVSEGNIVMIDGETRRKKCNIKHLEPTAGVLEIKKGASHDDIRKAFKKLGIEIPERKAKQPAPEGETPAQKAPQKKPLKKEGKKEKKA